MTERAVIIVIALIVVGWLIIEVIARFSRRVRAWEAWEDTGIHDPYLEHLTDAAWAERRVS